MKRGYILERLTKLVGHTNAHLVLEMLEEEGVLHLGYGDADIDLVLNTFKECFETTKNTKLDRYAANRLVNKHSSQAVSVIIRLLKEHSDAPYAPVVNSVAQLEDKWASVLNFVRKQGDNEVIPVG